MTPNKKFDPTLKVISRYRPDEIIESKLFDFVSAPIGDPALETWTKHLVDQKIPYLITVHEGNWYEPKPDGPKGFKTKCALATIWKRLVVEDARKS